MSTSFRPQTDGQTKKVNLVIQQFLRNYVAADQQDWVDHLELVEFCYNNLKHSGTGSTPFQMVTGKSLIVPMTWASQGQPSSDASEEVPMVTQLDEERRHLWELAKANLEKAHKRYTDFVDKSRREVKFQVGNEVWLNIKNFRLPKELSHKFLGPFKVLEKKLSDTYKLELSENLRVKWKGYHPIEASWVNESDMEHAQEAIEEFHTRPTKKKRRKV
jgi:hypothetical protein